MTTFEMKAIRFRSEEGVRNGVLVGEGPKWLKLILPDCRGIRVTEVSQADRQFVTDLDVPVKKALTNLKIHAARVGCLQSAADVLGIKAIEPPRDADVEGPTLSMMKKEFENMASNIKKAAKATDKKPRAKREPKAKVAGAGPTTRAREAAMAYISTHKLTHEKLADREVSRAVKDAMIKAAPDAALATIATQFSNVKRSLAA